MSKTVEGSMPAPLHAQPKPTKSREKTEKKTETTDFRVLPQNVEYTAKSIDLDFGGDLGVRRRSIYQIKGKEFFRDATPLVSKRNPDSEDISIEVFRLIDFDGKESKYLVKCADTDRLKREFNRTPKHLLPRYRFFTAESEKEARLLQVYAGIPILDFLTIHIQKKNKDAVLLFTIMILKKAYAPLSELHEQGYAYNDMHCEQLLCDEEKVTLIDYEDTEKSMEKQDFIRDLRRLDKITEQSLELIAKKYPSKYSLDKVGSPLLKILSTIRKSNTCKDTVDYLSTLATSKLS